MRWILLDEVIEIQEKKYALTRARVPDAEFSAEMLLLEMMAQTGGLLLGAESNYRDDVVFGKVEKAVFEGPLTPGETLEVRAAAEDLRPEGAWIDGTLSSGNKTVAAARFFLVNAGRLVPESPNSITFPETFLNHFRVREKTSRAQAVPGDSF